MAASRDLILEEGITLLSGAGVLVSVPHVSIVKSNALFEQHNIHYNSISQKMMHLLFNNFQLPIIGTGNQCWVECIVSGISSPVWQDFGGTKTKIWLFGHCIIYYT